MTDIYNMYSFKEFIDEITVSKLFPDSFISKELFEELKQAHDNGIKTIIKVFEKYSDNFYDINNYYILGDKRLFDIGSNYIMMSKYNNALSFHVNRLQVARWSVFPNEEYGVIYTPDYITFGNKVYNSHTIKD